MAYYEHEIPCPTHKGILNYLWVAHFHDSEIYNIAFDDMKQSVTLTLECSFDRQEKWEKLRGDDEARRAYIDRHVDEFTYKLTFRGVRYFHAERLPFGNDYLYGLFLDTALRRKLEAETGKKLYHFRIVIEDGFMDIVFSKFHVRKNSGKVQYPIREIDPEFGRIASGDPQRALDGDDSERSEAMQLLYRMNDSSLLKIARKNIGYLHGYMESCEYSAYLLGKLGDATDIPALTSLYVGIEEALLAASVCRCSTLLPKRMILDAIEMVHYRSASPTPTVVSDHEPLA